MREERYYDILSNDAPTTAIVDDRIFWDVAPQNTTTPFIVLTFVSGVPDDEIDGTTAFDRLRLQVDCYATGKAGAITLGQAVRAAIQPDHGYVISLNPAPYDPASTLYRDSADYELIEFTEFTE